MARPAKYKIGDTFGDLVIVGTVDDCSTPYKLYRMRCSCGEHINATSTHLRGLTHCGCKGYGNGRVIPGGLGHRGKVGKEMYRGGRSNESVIKLAYNTYRYNGRKRGYTWDLSLDYFKKITGQDCHYCGASPSNEMRLDENALYTYNGIDRLDNTIGYTPDNVVSCCGRCNIMKQDLTANEFIAHAHAIASHSKSV